MKVQKREWILKRFSNQGHREAAAFSTPVPFWRDCSTYKRALDAMWNWEIRNYLRVVPNWIWEISFHILKTPKADNLKWSQHPAANMIIGNECDLSKPLLSHAGVTTHHHQLQYSLKTDNCVPVFYNSLKLMSLNFYHDFF